MHLDIDARHPDDELIEPALSWRDGVLLALAAHGVLIALLIFAPKVLPAPVRDLHPIVLAEKQPLHFVFMRPRVDLTTKRPKPDAPASDKDRRAHTREPRANPLMLQPKALGNTPNKVATDRTSRERARGRGPTPEPRRATQPPQPSKPAQLAENRAPQNPLRIPVPDTALGKVAPPSDPTPARAPSAVGQAATPGGSLGDALQNLQQYVQNQQFNNPTGGGNMGPLQFDSKGVDFGPWIRRFIAQVRRNWFIPQAAMTMKGRVVLTFVVHKNGVITDLKVVTPSGVEAFNNSAFNALLTSNPTQPLPAAYPSDHCFFRVTFYYNETPPQ